VVSSTLPTLETLMSLRKEHQVIGVVAAVEEGVARQQGVVEEAGCAVEEPRREQHLRKPTGRIRTREREILLHMRIRTRGALSLGYGVRDLVRIRTMVAERHFFLLLVRIRKRGKLVV
jgi:hypothetical protein